MATVFDVAKYILEKKGQMSTMKLQKLCYYSQAWALVWDDCPLFEEDFEAWANGPVCPPLFQLTKGHFSVSADAIAAGNSHILSDGQKDTINRVLDYYGDKDAQWLSQLTHLEGPWKEARKDAPPGTYGREIITKESMAMYYGGL